MDGRKQWPGRIDGFRQRLAAAGGGAAHLLLARGRDAIRFRFQEETPFKPVSYRLVVEFQRGIGQGKAPKKDQQCAGITLRQGKMLVAHPCGVEIDQRIMRNIDGIGDVAQKTADPVG